MLYAPVLYPTQYTNLHAWGGALQGGYGRGLTSSEVMNDESTLTRVCLRGHVNTLPFVIERSVKRYVTLCGWTDDNMRYTGSRLSSYNSCAFQACRLNAAR